MTVLASVKDWLPLLVSLIGLIGGAIIYQVQKSADRRNEILRERRELYREFVATMAKYNLFCTLERNNQEFIEVTVKGEQLMAELLVAAPDHVGSALVEFEPAYRNLVKYCMGGESNDGNAAASQLFGEGLGIIVHEMRKDTFEDTNISAEMTVGALGLPTLAISWGKK